MPRSRLGTPGHLTDARSLERTAAPLTERVGQEAHVALGRRL